MKRSLSTTYQEGKRDKLEAQKKAGGKKRDDQVEQDAKKLLGKFLKEQKCWLLAGTPFMFAGSLIEFLAPYYIGRILNEFKNNNYDGDGGVYELLVMWMIWLVISAACNFVREVLFGITSQKIGRSIRQ